jgi:thiamine pyrophosphokinase
MAAKKGLIFGSSPEKSWDFLSGLLSWPDTVIAADGGILSSRKAGFSPSVYIGDGDSGGRTEPGLECVTLPEEKDVTDLEACYQWARDRGFSELVFTGCTGGRLDHHMAAMGLLETAAREGIHAVILDPGNRVEFLLPGNYVRNNPGYRYVSLIPADPVLRDLSIRGAKYELSHRDVARGGSLTVSNEFSGELLEVSFLEGCCWLIFSN